MIKAQNLILKRVFDKEFPEELTMENAQKYLSRLQGMELQRARIEGDEYFKEFYEEKYRIIKQQLLEKGMIWKSEAIKGTEYIYVNAHKYTSDEKEEEDSVYFDSESDSLKFEQNGQIYEFQNACVLERFIASVNSEIKKLEELRGNAMQQRDSEIQDTRRNLFQKIKEWISIKKNNRVQEEPTKDANDQR